MKPLETAASGLGLGVGINLSLVAAAVPPPIALKFLGAGAGMKGIAVARIDPPIFLFRCASNLSIWLQVTVARGRTVIELDALAA